MRWYDSIIVDQQLVVSQVHVSEGIFYANTSTQADWNSNTGITQILNKPQLSAVAFDGRFDSLLPNTGQATFNSDGSVSYQQVNADYLATSGYAQILNKPNLSNLAISASFNDIKPSTLPRFFDGRYSSLTGAPQLANVATTGRYTDLAADSLPEISQIGASGFLGDALYSNGRAIGQLSAVSFSGRYSDLIGTPANSANSASLASIATSGLLTSALLSNGTSVGVAGIPANLLPTPANVVTNAQLTTALSNLVTNTQLTTSLTNLVTSTQLAAATVNLVSNTQLAAATVNLVSNTQLSASLSNVVLRSNLSTIAQTGLVSDAKLANGTSLGSAYGSFSNVAFSGKYADLTGIPASQANSAALSVVASTGLLSDTLLSNGLSVGQAGNLKSIAFSGMLGDATLANGTAVSVAKIPSSLLANQPTALSQFTNDLRAPAAQANTIAGPFTPANTSVTLAGGLQQWQVSISATYQVNVYVDGVLQTQATPAFDLTGVHSTLPTALFATNLSAGPHTLSLLASNTAYTTTSDVASLLVTEFAVGTSSSNSTTWQFPTLQGSWTNVTGFQGASYKKNGLGETRLRGAVAGGAFGVGAAPIFTLPTGFTPSNTFVATVACDGQGGEVRVYSNGAVTAVRGNSSGTYLSLDNIIY